MKIKDILNIAKWLGYQKVTSPEYVKKDYYVPTEKDKKSNASSVSMSNFKTLFKPFLKTGCELFNIQDTNSMEPFIDDNTPVVVEPLTGSDGEKRKQRLPIDIGQICIYDSGNYGLIIHQVIGKSNNGKFKFRGINNKNDDYLWVKEDDILYRVVAIGYAYHEEQGD